MRGNIPTKTQSVSLRLSKASLKALSISSALFFSSRRKNLEREAGLIALAHDIVHVRRIIFQVHLVEYLGKLTAEVHWCETSAPLFSLNLTVPLSSIRFFQNGHNIAMRQRNRIEVKKPAHGITRICRKRVEIVFADTVVRHLQAVDAAPLLQIG